MAANNSMIYDKKTGRMRVKDKARSRIAKTAARRNAASRKAAANRGTTKLAISRGVKRALRTGRTVHGRKVRTRK